MRSIIFYYAVINIVAFFMYGADKRKAKNSEWRISESSLIFVSVAGGAFGALLGMKVFHHKVRKVKFQIVIPLMVIIHLAAVSSIAVWMNKLT
ncbi:MAG: DUF1294 domain-containing protein [Eubacterium sp.]|nr:DUF1294 domain-containing protein [Eubacterium sp.]